MWAFLIIILALVKPSFEFSTSRLTLGCRATKIMPLKSSQITDMRLPTFLTSEIGGLDPDTLNALSDVQVRLERTLSNFPHLCFCIGIK